MRFFKKILPFILCVLIILLTPLAYGKTVTGNEFPLQTQKQKMILTLWNIDVFEGGVWSRADFLSAVASDYAKDGVLVMVVSHTIDSAKEMIKRGNTPDIISFGAGADFVTEHAKQIPKISFLGGEINGGCYAYPWCVGGYFLISKNQDNQHIDRLFVSQNTFSAPFFALDGVEIQAKEILNKKPLDAYTAYLAGGKNDCLLGTQRDIYRLEKRGVEFYASQIGCFSDVVQYLSIFSSGERYDESLKFAEFLTGEKVQKTLNKIGMLSPFFEVEFTNALSNFDFKNITQTISPFTNASIILNIIDEVWQKNLSKEGLAKFKSVLKRL